MGKSRVLFFVLLSWNLSFSSPAAADEFLVNTEEDSTGSCDSILGDCSLREAIDAANSNAGGDKILIPEGIYQLTRSDEVAEDANQWGDLDVLDGDLVIEGAGANLTIIDAAALHERAFHIPSGENIDVTFRNLTIRNGNDEGGLNGGGGIFFNTDNHNTLTLEYCYLHGNTGGSGGGLMVVGGSAANDAVINIINSTFAGNSAATGGAAAFFNSEVYVQNSTFSGNEAINGGAIFSVGSFGNSVIHLRNVTVFDNHGVEKGGGISFASVAGNTSAFFLHTILSGNTSATSSQDCEFEDGATGTVSSLGFNIFGNVADCALGTPEDLIGIPGEDLQLGVLSNNLGPTPNHALLKGSPAVDRGNPLGCIGLDGMPLLLDQRGLPRKTDGNGDGVRACDIGSFEAQPCGDGVAVEPEECDDGNSEDGDGCDASCQIEVPLDCGNAVLELGEACDDGNAITGDGCDINCTISACGNGVLSESEQCEDGNSDNGDGCDSSCQIETSEEEVEGNGGCQLGRKGDLRPTSGAWMIGHLILVAMGFRWVRRRRIL